LSTRASTARLRAASSSPQSRWMGIRAELKGSVDPCSRRSPGRG
jgi:hypothetical protein